MVHIVSSNTDGDLAKARAKDEVDAALIELAANVLRVVRGAGRPFDILREAGRLVDAAHRFRDAANMYPSTYEIGEVLARRNPHFDSKWGEGEIDLLYAKHMVIRGALQIAASDLLEQRTQASAGDNELMEGVREMEKALDIIRGKRLVLFSARTKPRSSKAPKTKTP